MRKVFITGVSKGLGYYLAKELMALGCEVAGCSRSGTGPEGLKMSLKTDVADIAQVRNMAGELAGGFGTPEILVNNAALMNRPANLWEVSPEEFKAMMDVNICGTLNVISAIFPSMLEAGTGKVINLSSAWGRVTSPHVGPYCASKYAVEALSLAMSQEVPEGFAVVSLNPGFIDTEMVQGVFGSGSGAEDPAGWGAKAAKYILGLTSDDNGRQLSVS